MKRPSLTAACRWIAANDNAGDDEDVEALVGYISVVLVADIFDVDSREVAKRVHRIRHHELDGGVA